MNMKIIIIIIIIIIIVITKLSHKILKYSCVEDQNVIGDVCWYEQAVKDSWRVI
jgi:hypothetical protein